MGALATACAKLETSPLIRRFLGGAAWSVMGAAVSSGLTLVLMLLVARMMDKETYGQFIVIQSTLGMVGVFAGFGIGAAATRYVAELRRRDITRLGHILALAERTALGFGVIATIALLTAGQWMALHIFNAPDMGVPLMLAAGTVLFTAMDGYQKSVLIGFEAMRAFALGTIAGVLLGFPIMLIAASHFDLHGAATAMTVTACMQAVVSRRLMSIEMRRFGANRDAAGCLGEWPVLWAFALPALLSSALIGPSHWLAQVMLANTVNGFKELAVLGIAMQWMSMIVFIPTAVGRVVLPILTEHVTSNELGKTKKILLYAASTNFLIVVPLAFLISLLSPQIMLLYGPGFEQEFKPLVVATMVAVLLAIQVAIGNLVAAMSQMWLGMLMNAGWALVYLISAFHFAHEGAIGVMSALVVSYLAHMAWTGWYIFYSLRRMSAWNR